MLLSDSRHCQNEIRTCTKAAIQKGVVSLDLVSLYKSPGHNTTPGVNDPWAFHMFTSKLLKWGTAEVNAIFEL